MEVLTFLGQGTTVAEAVGDGLKTMALPFRPRDGKAQPDPRANVRSASGEPLLRTLKQFEADAASAVEDLGDIFG
jgi:hypothetical protein